MSNINNKNKYYKNNNNTNNSNNYDEDDSNESNDENIDTTLYILNETNKPITKTVVETILKKYNINIKVKNIDIFQKAMIHTSYLIRDDDYWKTHRSKNTNKDLEPIKNPDAAYPLQKESYERLEFLGDSVIHMVLAEYIFNRYQTEDEGFMTRLRTKIENGDALAHLGKVIGLDQYIVISRYIENNGGRQNNAKILEDAFEAFIGALKLDAGIIICEKFLVTLMEDEIDFSQLLHVETNFKDTLLQYFHKMGWQDPQYGQLDISGPDHKKMFTMYIKRRVNPRADGEIVGIGIGSSKKKGEQEAALDALKHFKQVVDSDDDAGSFEEYSSDEDDN